MTQEIFVFGSNLSGRHGKGAALHARKYYGAIYGQGSGLQGTSYAIPTKDESLRPLSLGAISAYVKTFRNFALHNPQMTFKLTPIGCGLAGFHPSDIAPMFRNSPNNVIMPAEFKEFLNVKQT